MWELDYKERWVLKNLYFWTVVLEETLESIWTTRRSNQFILKEISPEYSLEALMLKAETPTLGHLMWITDSLERFPWCWERLKAGGGGGDRGWDSWITSPIQWTWVGASSRSWWRTGTPGVLQSMGSQRVKHDWATELNWTENLSNFFHIFQYLERLWYLNLLNYI